MKKFISFALIAAMAVTTLVGCETKEQKQMAEVPMQQSL